MEELVHSGDTFWCALLEWCPVAGDAAVNRTDINAPESRKGTELSDYW